MNLKEKLYTEMLRLRIIEEYIAEIYHPGNEMKCPTHLYTGQEAVAVSVCNALKHDDVVSAGHRSHGWYIAKGGDLKRMMAELFGKITGCSKGWGGSMHIVDVQAGVMGTSSILGGTISHALGSALAFSLKKSSNVAVSAFGDAAIEVGTFHESLNFASLKKLPVIFVCENNLYSTQSPLNVRQPPVDIYRRAEAYNIPGFRVDGNNALEVYEKSIEAVDRARNGGGPTLIEAMTYRWREHVGPNYDYNLGYRSKSELEKWMKRCPIKQLNQCIDHQKRKKLEEEFKAEVIEAAEFARSSAFPTEKDIFV
jgi:TPP-dependent pyruvate/acetoin dehydrogenase alpha subunit